VLEALGIDRRASDAEIAATVRQLAGLRGDSPNSALWIRLLDGFTREVLAPEHQQTSDLGDLSHGVVWGFAWPDDDDVRWNLQAWGDELGTDDAAGIETFLLRLVAEKLGPALARKGLLRAR
jgi:hypothetical protein